MESHCFVASLPLGLGQWRQSSSVCRVLRPVRSPQTKPRSYGIHRSLTAMGSGRDNIFFATCARGLGEAVAHELRVNVPNAKILQIVPSGVRFSSSTMVDGARAAFWLRSATRVLHELCSAEDVADDVYDFVKESLAPQGIDSLIGNSQNFRVDVRASFEDEPVAQGVRRRIKDAICDQLRDIYGSFEPRPDSLEDTDVPIFATVNRGSVTIYRDLAGASLHKRGYRKVMHRSSLNESVAAGMLILMGWMKDENRVETILCDPFCGSGTLLLEAGLMDTRTAPGLLRKRYAFETWVDCPSELGTNLRAEARTLRVKGLADQFLGNDIHGGALGLAKTDASLAGLDTKVTFKHGDAEDLMINPGDRRVTVVSNPPWGLRLPPEQVEDAWRVMGRFLRREVRGGQAHLLCGSPEAAQFVRMKSSKKTPLRVGNVDCRMLSYEVFKAKVESTAR